MRLCEKLQKTPSEILLEGEEWLDYFSVLANADDKRYKLDNPKNKKN